MNTPNKHQQYDSPLRAQYRTTCRECGHIIGVGDPIAKRAGVWVHSTCPSTANSTAPTAVHATAPAVDLAQVVASVDTPTPLASPAPTPATFAPSPYQQAIFEWIRTGTGNAVVEAVAGSGKTTTIVKALEYTSPDARVAFVAFNAHIAKELKTRAPKHVHVSTVHSLGYRLVRKHFDANVRVDDQKVATILDEFMPVPARNANATVEQRLAIKAKRNTMAKLVSLAKAVLVDTSSPDAVVAMAERYGVELNGDTAELVPLLPVVIERCLRQSATVIDYDDMIYLPVVLGMKEEVFDWLFVDEGQDLNACQIEFLLNRIAPQGRVVVVGDRCQSLYGFRGADVNAIPNIITALKAVVLPLSITYRCPTSHVALAKEIVPHLEASSTAKPGTVANLTEAELMRKVQPGDMIICRCNAPLVPVAFALIKRGVKAVVRGRDFAKGLSDLAGRLGGSTMDEFYSNLADYAARERERLERRNAPETQLEALADKIDTLWVIAGECTHPTDIVAKIDSIFSDDVAGVVLSSVHRAKGLEAGNVFVLKPELMPMPKAKQDWEKEQELNIKYVALTRSKDALYFVS